MKQPSFENYVELKDETVGKVLNKDIQEYQHP
jgi:hypothetical protein